jgi:hypothetical protein
MHHIAVPILLTTFCPDFACETSQNLIFTLIGACIIQNQTRKTCLRVKLNFVIPDIEGR